MIDFKTYCIIIGVSILVTIISILFLVIIFEYEEFCTQILKV